MTDLIATLEGLTGQPTGDLTALYDGAKAAGIVTDWETGLWFGAVLRGHLDAPGAAIALVERVLPGWEWERTVTDTGTFIRLVGPGYVRFQFMGSRNPQMGASVAVRGRGFYKPDAIALLIALLRAKEAKDGR